MSHAKNPDIERARLADKAPRDALEAKTKAFDAEHAERAARQKSKLKRFAADRSSNTAVEWGVIAAILVGTAAIGMAQITFAIRLAYSTLDAVLDDTNNPSVDGN